MTRVNDHWIGAHTDPGDNGWARATYFSGCLALYRSTGQQRYLSYAKAWAEKAQYGIEGTTSTRWADHHTAGQVYYDLYEIEGGREKVETITESMRRMVYWDPTRVDDWTWVDALHMAMPVFVRAANYTGDDAYLEKLWELYAYPKNTLGLYDYKLELWYRDQRFQAPTTTPTGRPVFWSRGNGWAISAQAKTLGLLDPTKNRWPQYQYNIQGMARALRSTQRTDGFWGVNLGDPDQYPGPETSGTALFVFGLAYGIRTGILDRTTYLPVAARAWNALVTTAVRSDGLLGYVQGVGEEPSSNQPVIATGTADFAVGAFLLAGTELAKL